MYKNKAIDLLSAGIQLHADGRIETGERRMGGGTDGWTVAAFHVETDADVHGDHWEMHPNADELVGVVDGHARLCFEAAQGEAEEIVDLRSGAAVVVPRGRWHRVELRGPTDMFSITLRAGTGLRRREVGAPS
ncbi:cupin domain-containing protein [Pseudonocardia spinosispora]|uniref:cupin domain-containing protein n=1 Tax=Pseudonocardia spinosispora TaxID=103441 RepID=UPI0003F5589A|nr:cupin domain-containing protein [Pseudonocardia spinosispora]